MTRFDIRTITGSSRQLSSDLFARAQASSESGPVASPAPSSSGPYRDEYYPCRRAVPWGTYLVGGLTLADVQAHAPDDQQSQAAVILTPEMQDCCHEFEAWYAHRQWYMSRRIPWRRSWLFYGGPGTGKTVLATEIARRLKVPLLVLDLGSMSNTELSQLWESQVLTRVPCLVLIEDIDNIYHGRELKTRDCGPSFDALLNTIGGARPSDGVGLIITTNDMTAIDPALCQLDTSGGTSRPGRIDRALHFGPASHAQRLGIIQNILDEHPARHEQLLEDSNGDTVAQCTNRCQELALAAFWQRTHCALNGSSPSYKLIRHKEKV